MDWIIVVILFMAYAILIPESLRKRGLKSQSFFTYLLWVILDIVTFIAAVETGSDSLMLIFGCILFSSFLSFIFFKYDKEKKWGDDESATMIMIILVIIIWGLSQSNLLGLVLAVIAEIIAGWPQMKKSWKCPGTRWTLASYLLFIVGYMLSVLNSKNWELQNILFPLSFFIYCIGDTIPLIRKWWKIWNRYKKIKDKA